MTARPNLIQEDNLVRFLNDVSYAEEILEALCLKPEGQLLAAAERLMQARGELGAFFDLDDVEGALDLQSELGAALLEAARAPLIMSPAVERVHAISATGTLMPTGVMATSFLAPLGLLPAIKWEGLPQEWVRPLMFLMMEIAAKRLGIELKLARAEAAVAAAETQLQSLSTQSNPDAGVVATAKSDLKTAKDEAAAIEREAEALNKLVKKKDHKGVWAIVKRNLKADAKALRQRAAGMPTTTPGEVKEKQKVLAQAAAIDKTIEKVDLEVAGYKPPP